MEQAAIAQENG